MTFSQTLISAHHNSGIIKKVDKDFSRKLEFKDIKFLVKIRDIRKIERNNAISISVFCYENKERYPIYVSKNALKKNMVIYY